MICLLLAQACFWLVNLRLVEIPAAPAEPETALEVLSAAAAQTVAADAEASTSAPAGTKKVRLPSSRS